MEQVIRIIFPNKTDSVASSLLECDTKDWSRVKQKKKSKQKKDGYFLEI